MNRVLTRVHLLLDFFVEKPMRGLVLICGLQMVGWGILVTFFMPIPYSDILYHTFVGRSPDAYFWGDSYRHPPVAYWLTHWLNFGEPLLVNSQNIAAQLFVIGTYIAVYYMALALLNNKRDALVAVLLLIPLGVYQGAPTLTFAQGHLQGLNHNVLQYPFWILIPLVTFYATRPLREKARQSLWWLVLGVLLGMGCWTKISIGILYGTLLAWTLIDRDARQHYKTVYPYLAIILCLLIGAKPIYYGFYQWSHVVQYVSIFAFNWDRLNRATAILEIWAYMVGVAVLARGISVDTSLCYPFAGLTRRASHFLLVLTFMPFAVILVGSVYWQVVPPFYWTLPMYGLWGVVLVATMRFSWRAYTPHVILLAAIVLLLKPVYYYPLTHGFYPRADNHWVISEKIMNQWNSQTGNAPIGFVNRRTGLLGGLLSLYLEIEKKQHQTIYPDVKKNEELKQKGALIVFSDDDWHWEKNQWHQVIKDWQLPEQSMKIDEYPHVIYYAILPPADRR